MNRDFAIAAIEASFARGTATACSWAPDRSVYVAQKCDELRSYMIEPVQVKIQGETFHYGTKEEMGEREVFAIARSGTHWLIYAPLLDAFSLAFGDRPEQLQILGFASDDALAEWLG